MNAAIQILAIAGLLVILDLPWLLFTKDHVGKMLADIQKSPLKLRYDAAAVVYVALAYLLSRANSWRDAAATGFATYAVYDFTNLATLSKYDPLFAIADSLWGGVLMGAGFLAAQALKLV
jgi:uncharacterized membrane protein